MRHVKQLQGPDIWAYRSEVMELVAEALGVGRGEFEPADVITLALEDKLYIFAGFTEENVLETVLVAEIIQSPRKRWVNVLAYSGIGRHFHWYLPVLEHWAKMNGASTLRGYGPEAQMRLARRLGFNEIYRVYEKELGNAAN